MITPSIDECVGKTRIKHESFFKRNYPEFYRFITEKYPNASYIERLYLWFHPDTERTCKNCGKPTRFVKFNYGYNKYCCPACTSKDPNVKLQKIETCKEHYSVKNPSQNKNIVQKKQDTMMKRYGVTNTSKLESNKQKRKNTMLERYGVENAMQSEVLKNKHSQTNLERYGVEYPLSLKEIQEKAEQTFFKKYGGRGNASKIIKARVSKTKLERYGNSKYSNREKAKQTMIERYGSSYHKHNMIHKETRIEKFVSQVLDKYNILYSTNCRDILENRELDIYSSDYKVAFECNGVHWHRSTYKVSNYHIDKFNRCQEKGIRLVSFWSDHFTKKPEIVESIIRFKFNIYERTINSEDCTLQVIDRQLCKNFLDLNHLFGFSRGTTYLGLFHKNELVYVTTLQKRGDSIDIVKYCSKLNYNIVNGLNRIISYIHDTYNLKIFVQLYNDIHDITELNLVFKFRIVNCVKNCWYIKNDIRYNRYEFTNKNIQGLENYDSSKTLHENLTNNKYEKIWDTGITKIEIIND